MGYMRHHTIVCTSWNDGHIFDAHEKARELFGELVSLVSKPTTNYYRSFAIFPDGSKEGWLESNLADDARDKFIKWLLESRLYIAWVEVQFGDGEREAKVVNASDWQKET